MQALSRAGLADSRLDHGLESASPTTFRVDKSTCLTELLLWYPDIPLSIVCFSESSARKSTPPFGGVLSLTKIANLAVGRAGVELVSTATVDAPAPLNGGSVGARRGPPGPVRGAEAAAGANRRRNQGRKQAPSHGGLTRPVRRSVIDATEPGPACRAGPPRGSCAVRGRCSP